ncbi:hypothetical protein C8F01DRAFT_1024455 [Mycena amicta]|nr:hypothetical protein C8F01DRAFT_1024455 [Mycena amicta]
MDDPSNPVESTTSAASKSHQMMKFRRRPSQSCFRRSWDLAERPPLHLSLTLCRLASATQVPFSAFHTPSPQWANLSEAPSTNATANFLFDTVNNFLQHWPNTRYRNGHTIVPGTIAVGTLLFHGRSDEHLPANPEWTATDPEHAYHFCGSSGIPRNRSEEPPPSEWEWPTGDGCWQLTLVTTRPLQVLYFDGSSAANMRDGTLDTQDLLVWGEASPDRWLDERVRLDDLCAWGKGVGVDGFIRMEMDFELMLCDFHSGVDLVKSDYLAAWWDRHITPPLTSTTCTDHAFQDPRLARRALPHPSSSHSLDTRTPSRPSRELIADVIKFQTLLAGSWHNHFPGDLRVTLDYAKLVSFYDTQLVPSRAQTVTAERWDHRAGTISPDEMKRVKKRLEQSLLHPAVGSGVDWRALYRGVVDRWSGTLELLVHLLHTEKELTEKAVLVQRHLRILLTPYILHSARPNSTSESTDSDWAAPVWHVCATRLTAHIHSSLHDRLTASEHTLLRALDETNREICRRVVRMWSWGVEAGVDALLVPPDAESGLDPATRELLQRWDSETDELMKWLDWSVWVKCRPDCGDEELCYLPTWPYFWTPMRKHPTDGPWKRPQPRCIRKFEPYSDLSEDKEEEVVV